MELQLPKDGCNDLRDIPKTKAVGINLRMGTLTKRLWFEIGNDEETRKRFDLLCKGINDWSYSTEWSNFLQHVESTFAIHGFFRIAK